MSTDNLFNATLPSAIVMAYNRTTGCSFPRLDWNEASEALRSNQYDPESVAQNLDVAATGIQKCDQGLQDYKDKIQDLDNQISHIRLQIIALENRKKQYQHYQTTYRGTLSPIRKLPPEVLGTIFSWTTCDISEEWSMYMRPDVDFPAQPLGAVCTFWRALVLSMPRLWSTFRVEIPSSSCDDISIHSRVVGCINLFLSRSSNLPLIFKYNENWLESLNPSVFSQTLQLIPQRWGNIELELSRSQWHGLDGLLSNAQFSSLVSAQVVLQVLADPFPMFPDAPLLRDASVRSHTSVTLPWDQLVTLSINFPWDTYEADCLFLNRLERLSLNTEFLSPFSSVTLNVVELALDYEEPDRLAEFLSFATLPSLRTLELCSQMGSYSTETCRNALSAMISRSNCDIRSLKLSYWADRPESSFLSVLEIMPQLTILKIVEEGSRYMPTASMPGPIPSLSELRDVFLRRLTPFSAESSPSRTQTFLPSLEEISIQSLDGAFSDAVFVEMVQSRVSTVEDEILRGLKKVKLSVHERVFDRSVLPYLAVLRDGGLDIGITDSGGNVL